MIDRRKSFESISNTQLNAAESLALGQATLRAAFLSPSASWQEGNDMLAAAFALRRQAYELGLQE
jgi:hypothetical protein